MVKEASTYQRYERQMVLPGFGVEAQERLVGSSVLIIGAGGLGVPCMLYLAGAGVGKIMVADDDVVTLSNLHRQVIYTEEDLGKPKAIIAADFIARLNSEINVQGIQQFADAVFCAEHIAQFDIVVDCTDSLAARYCISDACHLFGKPYVHGAVSRYECQVAVFHSASTQVGYRSLFPHQPQREPPNCAEQGVPGMLAGIAGCMQAMEVLKYLSGIAEVDHRLLHTYHALSHQTFSITLSAGDMYPAPQNISALLSNNYHFTAEGCSANTIAHLSELSQNVTVIDIREAHELSTLPFKADLHLPFSDFANWPTHEWKQPVVLVCASGRRSSQALDLLLKQKPGVAIYHLEGGINSIYNL